MVRRIAVLSTKGKKLRIQHPSERSTGKNVQVEMRDFLNAVLPGIRDDAIARALVG